MVLTIDLGARVLNGYDVISSKPELGHTYCSTSLRMIPKAGLSINDLQWDLADLRQNISSFF